MSFFDNQKTKCHFLTIRKQNENTRIVYSVQKAFSNQKILLFKKFKQLLNPEKFHFHFYFYFYFIFYLLFFILFFYFLYFFIFYLYFIYSFFTIQRRQQSTKSVKLFLFLGYVSGQNLLTF